MPKGTTIFPMSAICFLRCFSEFEFNRRGPSEKTATTAMAGEMRSVSIKRLDDIQEEKQTYIYIYFYTYKYLSQRVEVFIEQSIEFGRFSMFYLLKDG